jgi:hypothetical protein
MFKRINPETKTHRLFEALASGEKLTPAQIQKRFGIKNVSAEVSRVRQSGYAVYANQHHSNNGKTVTRYELGLPSRTIVAAGYRALALGL